jgi:hypothetical protein
VPEVLMERTSASGDDMTLGDGKEGEEEEEEEEEEEGGGCGGEHVITVMEASNLT